MQSLRLRCSSGGIVKAPGQLSKVRPAIDLVIDPFRPGRGLDSKKSGPEPGVQAARPGVAPDHAQAQGSVALCLEDARQLPHELGAHTTAASGGGDVE